MQVSLCTDVSLTPENVVGTAGFFFFFFRNEQGGCELRDGEASKQEESRELEALSKWTVDSSLCGRQYFLFFPILFPHS